MKTAAKIIILCLLLTSLSACAILPEEEEYVKAPVLHEEKVIDYELTFVKRGDIANVENLSCRYRSVKEATLAFRVGELFYDEIHVSKGDLVKEGDVLAELLMGSLNEDILQLELTLERLKVDLKHEKENAELAIEKHEVLLSGLSPEAKEKEKTLSDVRDEWDLRIEAIEDSIYINAMRLDEYREDKAKRQIIAPFDGTITYVRSVKDGDVSVEGERFIRIADTTSSVFVGETRNWAYLNSGDLVEITVSKNTHTAKVMTAEELGIERTLDPDYEKKEVFFSLLQPVAELEAGDRGKLEIVMDTRENTLYIENKAVVLVDEKPAVYVKDEYGLKSVRFIEIGVVTAKETEVLSGLEEGEAVILS